MNRAITEASKVVLTSILAVSALGSSSLRGRPVNTDGPTEPSDSAPSAIKVTISTGGGLFGPPKTRYKVGQQVPVTITMTNTSSQPVYVCLSGPLYQDLPKLVRDGQVLSYLNWQSFVLDDSRKNKTCQNEDLPEPTLLMPNQPKVVDWLIISDDISTSTGALAWYEQLPPGKYELSIQRRLDCCDGPMAQSNKISFEVVP